MLIARPVLHCCLYVVGALDWASFVKCLVIVAPFCSIWLTCGCDWPFVLRLMLHLLCVSPVLTWLDWLVATLVCWCCPNLPWKVQVVPGSAGQLPRLTDWLL